jgi:predicted GNAT superfamily acetyltransferase
MAEDIEIRECETLEELASCVDLQRRVFALPEIEISPVRHFVVTKNAGGFVLGAFSADELIGFVLSVPAFLRGEKAFYSHMTAVDAAWQGAGVGAKLKWAQRDCSLDAGVKYIKWTFEPWKARNAFFNLEKLGAIVADIQPNFYGTDYPLIGDEKIGLASDRLFAEWHLESERVRRVAAGEDSSGCGEPAARIVIPAEWAVLLSTDPERARDEQLRIRNEFQTAFGRGLVGKGFVRDQIEPHYLLYRA